MRVLSKSRWLLIRGCLLATLVVLCGWYRWTRELHYREFFVRTSGISSVVATTELFASRPDGRLAVLQRMPAVENLWVFQNTGPVTGIVAAWHAESKPGDIAFEVRTGGSWTGDAVHVESQIVEQPISGDSVLRRELDRRGHSGAIVVRPVAYASSVLSGNQEVVNWGGDGLFVAVVMMQALLGAGLLELFLAGLRAAAGSWEGVQRSVGLPRIIVGGLVQAVRVVALIVLTIQLEFVIEQFLGVRDAEQYLLGAAIASVLGGLYWIWVRWVSRTASQTRLLRGMLVVGCVIFCLKLLCLQMVNSIPCSDYAQYYRLGQLISEGDWDSTGPKHLPLTQLFIRRSVCFSYPITALFGSEISAFEYSNTVAQALSAAMMTLLAHRIWGLQTAARFLPLVLFVPEFWYSAGIVSHNVWGYLWIPLVWLLADVFVIRTERRAGMAARSWLIEGAWTVLFGVTVGIGIGMVDLLKHYGPFFLLAILIAVLFRSWLVQSSNSDHNKSSRSGVTVRVVFLMIVMITSVGFWSSVDSLLISRSGVVRSTFATNIARLASTETGSRAITTSWTIWTNQFFLRLPPNSQLPLQVRKALHEHLASGLRLWQQYRFKAQLMAVQTNAMTIAQDTISAANQEHSIRFVPWGTMQATIAWLVSGSLMSAGILRLLIISVVPVTSRELFPVLSVIFVMAVAFVLTDAHPYTGQNLAFPLCCAMAVLPNCGKWWRKDSKTNWQHVIKMLRIRKLFFGLSIFVALILTHAGLGMLVDHNGLTFHRITAVEPNPKTAAAETMNIDPAGVQLIGSRLHAGMRLLPLNRHISPGMRVVRHFRVTADRGKLNGLKFLITGNPREFLHGGYANRAVVLANAWKDLPIRYSVAIEGREIVSGRVGDLARVRLAEYPATFWQDQRAADGDGSGSATNSVLITLTLESDGSAELSNLPWPPSLAVECFH